MKIFLKIIILIFLFICTFSQSVFAEDVYKVTSFNYDTSNTFILLTVPDTIPEPVLKSVKFVKMENPTRAYFDITPSVLTVPKQDWTFTSNGLKQVIVSQNSTNPDVVRTVMYFDPDYDISKIHFYRIKNNIIIQLKDTTINNDYFQNTYRDDHASSSDFYEYLTMTTPEVLQADLATEIQEAFNAQKTSRKETKLNTKYYIDSITAKQNAILLNGFGAITIEKPMILTNPSRIVYDIPNALVRGDIRNTEYTIGTNETVKIGQFSVNKARIVITTEDVKKYIPVISSDNQSLLIANCDKIKNFSLFSNVSNMISYTHEKIDDQTNSMTLAFTAPVVHGINRENDLLTIYLYNVENYNEDDFKVAYKGTPFANAQISLIPKIGLKMTIPLEQNSLVNTFLGADGQAFKIIIKTPKKQQPAIAVQPVTPTVTTPKPTGKGVRKVVIDAGHGGTDYGAIRDNINEKDITLDVAKQVRDMLVKKGYVVQMTRDSDEYVSLQDRVAISENFKPDIFISIHVNSSTGTEASGIETHYYHQESIMLAQTLHASLASAIDTKNRGLFKSKFYVINHTTVPAILMEIGFISNSAERAELNGSARKKATAKAIVEGVENYFDQLK